MKRMWFGVGIVVGALTAGTVAVASIPDANGTIHACRNKKTGVVRVIDKSVTKRCKKSERALRWNQRGPAGVAGEAGSHLEPIAITQQPGRTDADNVVADQVIYGQTIDGNASPHLTLTATCQRNVGTGEIEAVSVSVVTPDEGTRLVPEGQGGDYLAPSPLSPEPLPTNDVASATVASYVLLSDVSAVSPWAVRFTLVFDGTSIDGCSYSGYVEQS